MLGNIKLNERGVTLVELLITISVASIVLLALTSLTLYTYGDTLRANTKARLSSESQTILRSMVEELRQSSSIRASNTISDPHAPSGGWNTSNANFILIISTPALDSNNNFIMNNQTGFAYQNEIVYFAVNNSLYKRFLANSNASGNTVKTTCPRTNVSSTCPPDILLSDNFADMNFVFYDQNDDTTNNMNLARSLLIDIDMRKQVYGQPVEFTNTIRSTIRNTAS